MGGFCCLGVEILKNPKKPDFGFAFRRFGFVSLGVPFGDVGGCSGDDGGVDLAARRGLGVKKSKYGVIFAFLGVYGVPVAHKSS
jgi:hypothetical protein